MTRQDGHLDRFARVRAALDAGRDLAATLAEGGIRASEWEAVERHALEELGRALERGDEAVIRAFDERYRGAWLEQPPVAPATASAAVPAASASPPAVPTFETSATSIEEIERAILPYRTGARQTPAPAALDRHPAAGETAIAPSPLLDDPLPFAQAPRAPSSDETAFLPAIASDEVAAPLPFESPAGAARPPASGSQAASRPDLAGGTAELPALRETAAIPFPPVSPEGNRRIGPLTLQRAAALEVELSQGFGDASSVLATFGISAADYRHLRRELAALLESDPALAMQYGAEREAYAAWRRARAARA
jgi:hypothetical protein